MTTTIIESFGIIGTLVAAAAIAVICGLALLVWLSNGRPRSRSK